MTRFCQTGLCTSYRMGHVHSPFNAILLPAMLKSYLLQEVFDCFTLNSLGFLLAQFSCFFPPKKFHPFIHLHVNRSFPAFIHLHVNRSFPASHTRKGRCRGVSKYTRYQNSSPRLGRTIVIIEVLASANPFVFKVQLEGECGSHELLQASAVLLCPSRSKKALLFLPTFYPPLPSLFATVAVVRLSSKVAALQDSQGHHSSTAVWERWSQKSCGAILLLAQLQLQAKSLVPGLLKGPPFLLLNIIYYIYVILYIILYYFILFYSCYIYIV